MAGRSIISIIYCPPNSSIFTFLEELTDWVSHLLNRHMDQRSSLLDHVITRVASSTVLDKPRVLHLVSDYRLVLIGISKYQAPGKTTTVRFWKLNDISTQVIQQEHSDLVRLCQKADDPNTFWRLQIKPGLWHWTEWPLRRSPWREMRRDSLDSMQKPWYWSCLRGRLKPNISSPTLNRARRYTNRWEMYICIS